MNKLRQIAATGILLLTLTALSADEVILQLEKSTDLQSWEAIPVTPEIVNEHGELRQQVVGEAGFFRLQISILEGDPTGVNYVHFTSHQAGSYTEIDDVALKDLDTNTVVLADDFSTRIDGRWIFKHVQDQTDSTSLVETDSSFTRIDGTLQLECIGYGQNGSGGYESTSAALLNQKLPRDFSLTFRAKRNQWGGHFHIWFAPDQDSMMSTQGVGPQFVAYSTQWEGSNFGRTKKFENDQMVLVRGHHKSLSTGTSAWHDFEIRKEGSTVQVFVNGNLVQTDDLNAFNYSLL